MIISDFDHHKVDISFSKDDYIKITAFHKKGDEWTTKQINLSPETFDKMIIEVDRERSKRDGIHNK